MTKSIDKSPEDFKHTNLFKKLVEDAKAMQEDVSLFNEEFRGLMRADNALLGRLLNYHLIAEHFVDLYLRAANPSLGNPEKARLTFYQKVRLMEGPDSRLTHYIPGLLRLNELRNRAAHRLDASLSARDLEPMETWLAPLIKALGEPMPRGMDFVERFVMWACAMMYGDARIIGRHGKGRGLRGLHEWFDSPEDRGTSDNTC